MTPNRKSIKSLTASGLRKCTQFYRDAVHAYCTPAEYYALCLHFDYQPRDAAYYQKCLDSGVSFNGTHYIHVKKFKEVFPKNKHYIDCYMAS